MLPRVYQIGVFYPVYSDKFLQRNACFSGYRPKRVARAHGVSVADVHAAVRGAAEHTKALGALTPEELVAYLAHKSRNREP